jgi:hypothetical protein
MMEYNILAGTCGLDVRQARNLCVQTSTLNE